jgi:hypothetical protein
MSLNETKESVNDFYLTFKRLQFLIHICFNSFDSLLALSGYNYRVSDKRL